MSGKSDLLNMFSKHLWITSSPADAQVHASAKTSSSSTSTSKLPILPMTLADSWKYSGKHPAQLKWNWNEHKDRKHEFEFCPRKPTFEIVGNEVVPRYDGTPVNCNYQRCPKVLFVVEPEQTEKSTKSKDDGSGKDKATSTVKRRYFCSLRCHQLDDEKDEEEKKLLETEQVKNERGITVSYLNKLFGLKEHQKLEVNIIKNLDDWVREVRVVQDLKITSKDLDRKEDDAS